MIRSRRHKARSVRSFNGRARKTKRENFAIRRGGWRL